MEFGIMARKQLCDWCPSCSISDDCPVYGQIDRGEVDPPAHNYCHEYVDETTGLSHPNAGEK